MDQTRLAAVTRSLTRAPSRRDVLRGLAATGIGLGVARLPLLVVAQERKSKGKAKDKPKKPKPNQYGCLKVGDPCKRAGQCCSNLCKGKPGKKICKAHDIGTCKQNFPSFCDPQNPTITVCNSDICVCLRTTAGSNFCANANYVNCTDCQTDADCKAEGFPAGTACVPLAKGQCDSYCPETGMACMVPCGTLLPEPTAGQKSLSKGTK